MNRILVLLTVFAINIVMNAQVDSKRINREINTIYFEYSTQVSELDKKYLYPYKEQLRKKLSDSKRKMIEEQYEKNLIIYKKETLPYQEIKIEKLKNLLHKINEENPIKGRKTVYNRENPEEVRKIEEAKKNPDYSHYEYIEIGNEDEKNILGVNNISQIRTDFMDNFDTSNFEDYDQQMLTAKILFILDIDGYVKKIKIEEGRDDEFSYLCAFTLYTMNKNYQPATYNGEKILYRYALPMKMQFE